MEMGVYNFRTYNNIETGREIITFWYTIKSQNEIYFYESNSISRELII